MDTDSYKFYARGYDLLVKPLTLALRRRALDCWRPRADSWVLDVGCGTGLSFSLLTRQPVRPVGIDLSPSMLSRARHQVGGRVPLIRADGCHLPFEKEIFEHIIIFFVFHETQPHIRLAVLHESARILHNRGRITIIDYHPYPERSFRGWQIGRGINLIERMAGCRHHRHYRNFMAAGGLHGMLDRSHLMIDRLQLALKAHIGIYVLKKRLRNNPIIH